jgi:soluble lytic murein transglycosylase
VIRKNWIESGRCRARGKWAAGVAVLLAIGTYLAAGFAEDGGANYRVKSRASPAKDPSHPGSRSLGDLVRENQWNQAIRVLDARPEAERLPGDQFARGYFAFRAGQHHRSLSELGTVAEAGGHFTDLAHFYAAKSAWEAREYGFVVDHALKVDPKGAHHRQASLLLGRGLIKLGQNDQGRRALRAYIGRFSTTDGAVPARLDLAKEHERLGETSKAAQYFSDIIDYHPLSRDLREARQGLERLMSKLSAQERSLVKTSSSSPDRIVARAHVLFGAHRSQAVVDDLEGYLKKGVFADNEGKRCEALYLVARSLTKLRKHEAGESHYAKLVSGCRTSSYHVKALYLSGKGLWNRDDARGALARFRNLASTYPDHSYADDVLYFSARIHEKAGRWKEAETLLSRQTKLYPRGDMADDAHWLRVRRWIKQGKHRDVIDYVSATDSLGVDDQYSRGRLKYFRARSQEQLGLVKKAKESYAEVVRQYPMTYYALMALQRLGPSRSPLAGAKKRSSNHWIEPPIAGGPVSALPAASASLDFGPVLDRVAVLSACGLSGLARQELAAWRRVARPGSYDAWQVAAALHKVGSYTQSHDIPRREIGTWIQGYPGSDRSRWDISFPQPFRGTVRKWAESRGLPMAIIYAIMREESGFSASIESWANAKGLMQLMDKTAARIARKDGLAGEVGRSIFLPDTNIRLGSAYLQELSSQSDAHPVVMAAAYNGGWGNVSGWLGNAKSNDLDLWIEDIPFGQTRNYAKRVVTSFWIYSWLLHESKVPRFSMELGAGAD